MGKNKTVILIGGDKDLHLIPILRSQTKFSINVRKIPPQIAGTVCSPICVEEVIYKQYGDLENIFVHTKLSNSEAATRLQELIFAGLERKIN